MITSPSSTPPTSAGLSSTTCVTRAPSLDSISKALAASLGYPVGDVRPPLTTFKELGSEGEKRVEKLSLLKKVEMGLL